MSDRRRPRRLPSRTPRSRATAFPSQNAQGGQDDACRRPQPHGAAASRDSEHVGHPPVIAGRERVRGDRAARSPHGRRRHRAAFGRNQRRKLGLGTLGRHAQLVWACLLLRARGEDATCQQRARLTGSTARPVDPIRCAQSELSSRKRRSHVFAVQGRRDTPTNASALALPGARVPRWGCRGRRRRRGRWCGRGRGACARGPGRRWRRRGGGRGS